MLGDILRWIVKQLRRLFGPKRERRAVDDADLRRVDDDGTPLPDPRDEERRRRAEERAEDREERRREREEERRRGD